MPCYLFTFHAYGSWMPDRPQGYVRRNEGVQPPDADMAEQYRRNMSQDAVLLSEEQQRTAIEILLDAAGHIEVTIHAVATEPTHVHTLTSWKDDRGHERNGDSLKRGLTIGLKKRFGVQEWLSENRSRKRVKDREHYDHLIANYVPKHSGWCWDEVRGYYKTADG